SKEEKCAGNEQAAAAAQEAQAEDGREQWHATFYLTCEIAPSRADAIAASLHFDTNRVPPSVSPSGRLIAEIVLLAQLVGDACRRRIEVARTADDLGAPAAVVGHVAERRDVHAIVEPRGLPVRRPA